MKVTAIEKGNERPALLVALVQSVIAVIALHLTLIVKTRMVVIIGITKKARFNRFKVEKVEATWKLPKDMAIYVNESLQDYVSDVTLRDTVLKDNTVPSNIHRAKNYIILLRIFLRRENSKLW